TVASLRSFPNASRQGKEFARPVTVPGYLDFLWTSRRINHREAAVSRVASVLHDIACTTYSLGFGRSGLFCAANCVLPAFVHNHSRP
ncbi:hypothetical protein, partial [Raoultella ornithinolytica]|uniref:hypothetical protein n=1 Tax=Raoultella ornithinolytica TaxID=54291 RepID=UPI002350324A